MKVISPLILWFDSYATRNSDMDTERVEWIRIIPFIFMHLMCFAVIWVGFSWIALTTCIGFYLLRMFAITGFYHRYFAHNSFKTSRALQFIFAIIGNSSVQRGPLWWAAQHRHHHRFSDEEDDAHSPGIRGFIWSHILWFLCNKNFTTKHKYVKDWRKFPELVFLDRFDMLVPVLTGIFMLVLGIIINFILPELGTSGPQMLIWGFFVSTVMLFHATFSINSLGHLFGGKRYKTGDDSRNNLFLALITLGEGWHNNHHHYPLSTRQGFYWWEIDISWYILWCMSKLKLIWDLKPVRNRDKDLVNG